MSTTQARRLPRPGTHYAAIYRAVLSGATTIDEITPAVLVPRQQVSVNLSKLYQAGLLSRVPTGNGRNSGKPFWKYSAGRPAGSRAALPP
ncbi:MAG TPA: hypothetical protein VJ801_02335, partial [Polyangia bacterium]|nr:hypothetical protein [Polyangia bacterium]